jgi:hypothetical protein
MILVGQLALAIRQDDEGRHEHVGEHPRQDDRQRDGDHDRQTS